jgi:muramoyltetrapeptide carboxypeptidase
MAECLRMPPPLRQGDTVALVAPSGPPDPNRVAAGVRVLEGLGLRVVVGKHVLERDGYLAGTDADRAADLREAWCDPSVAGVICVRGGYGASRLLGLLDWKAMAQVAPKTLLGSSDITALHQALAVRLGVGGCFGPMTACDPIAGEGGPEPRTLAHLTAALFGGQEPIGGDRVLVPGRAEAPLTGGNLSLLAALCGTPFAPRFAGRIALLEDIGEEPYRIDRMLTQLLHAGAFEGVAGIALGSWVDCGDPMPVLAERLVPLGVPVIAGLPVGHGTPQLSVWLGGLGVIDTQSCSLTGLFRRPEGAM